LQLSVELHAFVARGNLPTRQVLQAAIDAMGFPIELDPSLDFSSAEGFQPCMLRGEPSGCEIWIDPATDITRVYPHLVTKVVGLESVVTFRWGGDLLEAACGTAVAAALAVCANAKVYFPDDDAWVEVEELQSDFAALQST
jgi:hypothetical protein